MGPNYLQSPNRILARRFKRGELQPILEPSTGGLEWLFPHQGALRIQQNDEMFANDQRVNPIGTVLLQVHHCENALTVRGENPPRDTAIQIHFVNGIRSRESVTGRQPALFDRVMGIVRSRRESLGKSVRSEAADESTRCQIVPDQTTLRSPIIPDRSRADSPEREEPITAQEALRAARSSPNSGTSF